MPELPEVETTRRGIAPHCVGKIVSSLILRQGQLRWPVPSLLMEELPGQTLLNIERRGKYLLLEFANGTALWHLGMSGNLRVISADSAPGKHDHIDLCFTSGICLRFNDPRRFGALLWQPAAQPIEKHKLLAHLGPEPLSDAFDADYLWTQARNVRVAIKPWIMDAKVVVGVGNIYANESLFNAKLHPQMLARDLTRVQAQRWVLAIKTILQYAINRGGTTLRDFVGGDGKPGYFAQELKVYGRGGETCYECAKTLIEVRLGQRSSVYCPRCQKLPKPKSVKTPVIQAP
ncbi:MAG TPA: bifunctional DNA-formamidopyrimidine glycosylase/DNA-(apurinic or apyrimidinic site) lyase [Cellvibrionaceae bacterium]